MASATRKTLHNLPDEIFLYIVSFLDEPTIATLQLVSKKLRALCCDDKIWKWRCFENSPFLSTLRYKHMLQMEGWLGAGHGNSTAQVLRPSLANANSGDEGSILDMIRNTVNEFVEGRERRQLVQFRANWDPAYPGEKVSWYHEYIQRYGPTCSNWFENPVIRHGSSECLNEVRGLALFCPGKAVHEYATDSLFAVSPLDDGTVCLFDVKGTNVKKGAIMAKSRPGLLSNNPRATRGRSARPRWGHVGLTECVSVDNQWNRAFFAVPGGLAEVDLQRLEVVDFTSFEFSIMTLSTANPRVPLTVGTSLGLHLHDYRAPKAPLQEGSDKVDIFSQIFGNDPLTPYASLSQPSPLYIHHVPSQGSEESVSDDIYVSGRFTNILRYDRRKWPNIVGSIHSGASTICSLTSLPYRYSNVDAQARKWGQLTRSRLAELNSASLGGYTIVAGGEYGSKGSLELYGVTSTPAKAGIGAAHDGRPPLRTSMNNEASTLQNRQTVSSSKVLSIITHGTRLLFSDGNGMLKWFERDGTTEVRRHKIGSSEGNGEAEPSVFVQERQDGELARKILSTQTAHSRDRVNNDDVVFWTGEKLGLVTFSPKPSIVAEDFEANRPRVGAEVEREAQERLHGDMMRRALEMHADDVRLMSNLGLGLGRGGDR